MHRTCTHGVKDQFVLLRRKMFCIYIPQENLGQTPDLLLKRLEVKIMERLHKVTTHLKSAGLVVSTRLAVEHKGASHSSCVLAMIAVRQYRAFP